ncbi:DUF559 domain-containing protein [Plantactinospora sp. B5E13]|uniref:DUF559 domain-containing protein n=1 Tax=Plantactinospora sp. B5E13 TaxID=3153758 RepID=UPI00325E96C9
MPRAPHVPRELAFLPFSADRAITAGLLTRRMLRSSCWRRLLPDVYVHEDGYRPDDHRMWCDAVALTLPPGAALAGPSAAYLWGVDLLPRQSPVFVVLPEAARPRHRDRIVVAHHRLAPDDVTRFAGLPVTTGVRTAFDLGRSAFAGSVRRTDGVATDPDADRSEGRTRALVAVDALLNRRVVRLSDLAAYLAAHPRRPGTAQLRELLPLAEPLSESPMETRLRLVLYDAGLPSPTAQHEVYDARGRFLARVDLAYPRLRIALEYEGDHHRERAHFRRDVARLNALRAAGWLVLRFTADDVLRSPGRVVRQVAQALSERRSPRR